jgi:hypothetical protein
LSSILRKEYADTAIVIQTVCPMMVATKMAKVRSSSFFTPSPEKFVYEAVRSIGLVEETTGCLAHQIQVGIENLGKITEKRICRRKCSLATFQAFFWTNSCGPIRCRPEKGH